MSLPFDPYQKWLEIPPEHRPPDHYRLLGLNPFESDPKAIARAAEARVAHVGPFRFGEHADLAERILRQIAAARQGLLDPATKAAYDHALREREVSRKGPPADAGGGHFAAGRSQSAPAAATPVVDTSRVFSYVTARRKPSRRWWPWAALAAVAVSVVGLAWFLFGGRHDGGDLADQNPLPPWLSETPSLPVPAPFSPSTPVPDDVNQGDADQRVGPPVAANAADTDLASPRPTPQPGQSPDPSQSPPAEPVLGRLLADLIDPLDPGQHLIGVASATEEPGPESVSVRGDDQEPRRTVEALSKRAAQATTPVAKAGLAQEMADKALAMANAPSDRLELMTLACATFAEAGDLTLAFGQADLIEQFFDIDPRPRKIELLTDAVASTAVDRRQCVDLAMGLVAEAVAADDFDLASRAMAQALSAVRRLDDPGVRRLLEDRGRETSRLPARFLAVEKALAALAETPDDLDANLAVGQWRCFTNGRFGEGLPLLAKGADAVLADLATQDLAGPTQPAARSALADRWWQLATQRRGPDQQAMRGRAGFWYEQAVAGLDGLKKALAEKRLAEIAAENAFGTTFAGVVQAGNVALADNGTTVSGVRLGADTLLDGNATEYTGSTGLATDPIPAEWIFTFPRVYSLREIRFRLYDRDDRYYRYRIATSPDGEQYEPLVDRSEGKWTSWQRLTFPPRPVKAIKLTGLGNSANSAFHAVEFEAYCVPPTSPPP